MELVLPNNYLEIEQEEMMYLDGGDWETFKSNIKGLAAASQAFRFAARQTGLWGMVWGARTYLYSQVVVALAPLLGSVTAVNVVIGVVAGASAAAIGLALWNIKFY